jgi:predicted metal-binding protein
MDAAVHVCIGCKDHDPARREAGVGGGAALHAALSSALADASVAVLPAPCLGACRGGGRLVLADPAKWGWLIEGLDTPADHLAAAHFVRAWLASPNGRVAKPDRPTWTDGRLLGRFPPALPPKDPPA